MPIAKTKSSAKSQARLAQMAQAVKRGDLAIGSIEPKGLRSAVRSMMRATDAQLQTIKREARAKAGDLT